MIPPPLELPVLAHYNFELMNPPLRSKQRLENYKKAFKLLEKYSRQKTLNELEEQGLVQAFEYTYELAWKTLQDILHEKGLTDVTGPRPVIEQSFRDGLIQNGEAWMRMFKDRNLTTHTYNLQIMREILANVRKEYLDLFRELHNRLEKA